MSFWRPDSEDEYEPMFSDFLPLDPSKIDLEPENEKYQEALIQRDLGRQAREQRAAPIQEMKDLMYRATKASTIYRLRRCFTVQQKISTRMEDLLLELENPTRD